MNKSPNQSFIKFALLALLSAVVALVVVGCKRDNPESTPSDVDYYTCTMHPSVRSKVPGKCPICGMDLVPVKKTPAATNQIGAAEMTHMPGMPGADASANPEAEQPSDFTVPTMRQQQIGVTFAKVENRHFHHTVRVLGTVAYDKQRQWDYVTRVDGYVEKLDVFSPGEVVEKGAPLLTIYSPELYTAQKEFIDALKTEDAATAKGETDVLNSAKQLVESGKERLRLWNIDENQIAELAKTRQAQETLGLSSPFKGVVQDLAVDQGRRVAVGDKVVSVVDLSVVWVWAQFYQDDLPMLKKGLSVTITTASCPGEKFNGRINLIDPFINDALRTARVRIDVDNPDLTLRPDMYVDAELSMDMGEGLAAPVGAILPTGLHNIAFVDKGEGRLEPRFVQLGPECGDFYEVKSGLKENERVVASANFLIDAEAKIQGALKEW